MGGQVLYGYCRGMMLVSFTLLLAWCMTGAAEVFQVDATDDQKRKITVWPYKHECSDLLRDYPEDGVYSIHPPGGSVTSTWCDMTNGGWTVIQRRMDGSENFYRGCHDYVTGFGNRTGEYWLGLQNIHHLTKIDSELAVYMQAYPGSTPVSMTANYSSCQIGDNTTNYTLNVTGFTGTCSDALAIANDQAFSTFDNNNAYPHRNCASNFQGAWWYTNCHQANLNGLYYPDGEYSIRVNRANGIHWYGCWMFQKSAKFAVMKLRRNA